MSLRRLFFTFLVIYAADQARVDAQTPPGPASPPLQYVKIAGPKGMKATFYRGSVTPQVFDTPVIVALRPGYYYRLALSNLEEFPRESFFATLEARGSLLLSGKLRNSDFPASLNFSDDDFRKAANNVSIRKAILLERADHAIPLATTSDQPIEINIPATGDLLRDTRYAGVPLVLMHMGERKLDPVEMLNVPGTILLPGDKVLPAPTMPPHIPFACQPVFDPVAGPMNPSDLTALPDGGDTGLRAGITRDGKLVGIDATDTIAQYTDSRGGRRIAVSNRVGLCVPRYLVARTEFSFATRTASSGLGTSRLAVGESMVGTRRTVESHLHRSGLEALNVKTRASGISTEAGLAVTAKLMGIEQNVSTRIPVGVDATCPRPMGSEPKDGPLKVIKFPDKSGALVGDIVTFFIRYTNTGGQPMSGIIIADSLHTRYEYVASSAKSDRAANFSTQPNEAGSVQIRWQIQGELAPGEVGIVSFQVRVR